MAFLEWRWRSRNNWEPADYTGDETATVINVGAGDLGLGICIVRTREVFNGAGTAAKIIVGDGADPNGYLEDGNADETTTGQYVGQGAYWNGSAGPTLYTAADTIDIGFTANTSGTRTTGIIDLHVVVAPTAF